MRGTGEEQSKKVPTWLLQDDRRTPSLWGRNVESRVRAGEGLRGGQGVGRRGNEDRKKGRSTGCRESERHLGAGAEAGLFHKRKMQRDTD